MNQKNLILFLVLICPILAIPFIFREIYNQRYYALNYLAFIMGLFSYLWIPSGDLYRYYEDFALISTLNIAELIEYSQFDILMYLLIWIFSKLHLNYEWFRLALCVIDYLMIFSIFKSIVRDMHWRADKKTTFIIFLTLFGFLRFSTFLTGVRFTFALAIYLYAYYKIFFANKTSAFILLLLSCLIHFSFWPVLIIAILAYIFKPNISRKSLIVYSLIAYSVSTFMLLYLIDFLPLSELLLNHLENYTTGYYATGELENHSIGFRLAQIFSILSFYFLVPLSILRMKSFKGIAMCAYLLIFCILLYNMNSAFNRYATITAFSILFYFLLNPLNEFILKDLKIGCLVAIFVYAVSVYSVKRELRGGSEYLIFTPLPCILSHQYTDKWIGSNIEIDGNMVYQ